MTTAPATAQTVHAAACRELGLSHLCTQPYRPRTNGKAERFIQTLQNRWAYGALYGSSAERTAALPGWLTTTTSVDVMAPSATSRRSSARRAGTTSWRSYA